MSQSTHCSLVWWRLLSNSKKYELLALEPDLNDRKPSSLSNKEIAEIYVRYVTF